MKSYIITAWLKRGIILFEINYFYDYRALQSYFAGTKMVAEKQISKKAYERRIMDIHQAKLDRTYRYHPVDVLG